MTGIIGMYRRVPEGWAFVLTVTVSLGLAAIAGGAGAFAGVYLYDRGNSKGDDLAVFASGLLAARSLLWFSSPGCDGCAVRFHGERRCSRGSSV
jgi:hypothetical protein